MNRYGIYSKGAIALLLCVFSIFYAFAETVSETSTGTSAATAAKTPGKITELNPEIDVDVYEKDKIKFYNVRESELIGGRFLKSGRYQIKEIDEKTRSVQADYLLKPGDEIIIDIWGDLDLHYLLIINDDGFLVIPEAGRVSLNGVTFKEAKQKIINTLANAYSYYIDPNNPGAGRARVDISVGKITGIHIYVTGEVNNPGEITLKNTYASILRAIRKAGGISKSASIRNIKIKKIDGKEYNFDLYDFLFKGNLPAHLKYLSDGDIIFVPMRDMLVKISGSIARPGLYEVMTHENLSDFIELCGGLLPDASNKIKIIRLTTDDKGNSEHTVLVYNLESEDKNRELKNGDTVKIYVLENMYRNQFVTIEGDVKKPGRYKLDKNINLNALIIEAGGFKDSAVTDSIEIVRKKIGKNGLMAKKTIAVNYNIPAGRDFQIQNADHIIIKSDPYTKLNTASVTITGEVIYPGNYDYIAGERIDDLIQKAGGLKPGAFIEGAKFYRDDKRSIIELETAMKDKNSHENFVLYPSDKLIIPKADSFVNVTGAVVSPSRILFKKGEDINYYIEKSGGCNENANRGKTKILTPRGFIIDAINRIWANPEVPMGSTITVPSNK